jgi:hypothetical protein
LPNDALMHGPPTAWKNTFAVAGCSKPATSHAGHEDRAFATRGLGEDGKANFIHQVWGPGSRDIHSTSWIPRVHLKRYFRDRMIEMEEGRVWSASQPRGNEVS